MTVIGIGHAAAGDDAVALRAIDLLAGCPNVNMRKCTDPTDLVLELQDASNVILVDAVVGAGEPGHVGWLSIENLRAESVPHTHGMSVVRALDLASCVLDELPSVRILGICVDPPRGFNLGLSKAAEDGARHAAAVLREVASTESGVM